MLSGEAPFPQGRGNEQPTPQELERKILQKIPSEEDRYVVHNTIAFAIFCHGDQKRNTGEPFIVHPLMAMQYALQYVPDNVQIVKLLQVIALHDIIEDTEITKETLAQFFGEDIASAVDLLSKKENHIFKPEYQGESKNYFIMLNSLRTDTSISQEIRSLVLHAKVADRLSNVTTLDTLVPPLATLSSEARAAKQHTYLEETQEYIIPLLDEGNPLRMALESMVAKQQRAILFPVA